MAGGFRLIWIPLFAAVLDAQQPVQPSPKLETCSVEGQLVNAVTGEPVRKAEITVSGIGTARGQSYVTTTTAAGRFAVPDMEPGKYQMRASKRGYSAAAYGARGAGYSGTTLSLDPGQHLSGVVWRISPQAVITGRVLDMDGDPMPSMQVALLQYSFIRGKRQLAFSGQASTNDLGEYRRDDTTSTPQPTKWCGAGGTTAGRATLPPIIQGPAIRPAPKRSSCKREH